MSERENPEHDADALAAHAALSPEEAEHHERDALLPVAELADDDIAHAADTPPGLALELNSELPAPPDEIQMHTTHQPEVTDLPEPVTDGPMIRQIEELFPIAWVAMLFAVAYIGIYFAVDRLPNVGTNPLPGPGWF